MPRRRIFRILAIEGSNLPSLLIIAKDNAAVDNPAITIVRLNM